MAHRAALNVWTAEYRPLAETRPTVETGRHVYCRAVIGQIRAASRSDRGIINLGNGESAATVSGLSLCPSQRAIRGGKITYQRLEVRAIFLFFDPIRGWRRVVSRKSRRRIDWAQEVKHLVDVDYPDASLITLVCDNLNTHDIASLYLAAGRKSTKAPK